MNPLPHHNLFHGTTVIRVISRNIRTLVLGGIAVATPAVAQLPPPFHVDTVATGVFAVWESDGLANPVHGNTTIIVGERSVLVVDGSRTADAAEATLHILRGLTSKPVGYLVNTHWHEDHVLGNAVYADSFPQMEIVAHVATDTGMRHEASEEFPGFVDGLERQLGDVKDRLESGLLSSGQPMSASQRARTETRHSMLEYLVEQDRTARWSFPTLTFEDEMTIDLGGRSVRLLHLGRGNSAGDVVVFLPTEKVVAAGDLVVFPIPYGSGSFPVEWVETMRRFAELDFEFLVPGHGPVFGDRTYLDRVTGLLGHVVDAATTGRESGQTSAEVLEELKGSSIVTAFIADYGTTAAARRALVPFFLRPVVQRVFELAP